MTTESIARAFFDTGTIDLAREGRILMVTDNTDSHLRRRRCTSIEEAAQVFHFYRANAAERERSPIEA